jgi:hypothetical protein
VAGQGEIKTRGQPHGFGGGRASDVNTNPGSVPLYAQRGKSMFVCQPQGRHLGLLKTGKRTFMDCVTLEKSFCLTGLQMPHLYQRLTGVPRIPGQLGRAS